MIEDLTITTTGTIGLSQLASVFPLPVVKDYLERTQRYTCRMRDLPNELVFYYPMMMALDRGDSAEETVERLLHGAHNVFGRKTDRVPGKGGISSARKRLADEVHKLAFDELCKPLAKEPTPQTHFLNMLICAIDGTVLNVPDTEANKVFGKPKNQHGSDSSYPQVRATAVIECGTHAVTMLEIGSLAEGEVTLARRLVPRIQEDVILLGDRLFFGWTLVKQLISQNTQFLFRVKASDTHRFQMLEDLEDGSYLALYHPPKSPDHRKEIEDGGFDLAPVTVRICAYNLPNSEIFYLCTSLLDPSVAPAITLGHLYMQRWEIEGVYKELKVVINKNEATLRSQRPDLVRQELYGMFMLHYAIRSLIYEAARKAQLDPDCISFKAGISVVKRKSLLGGSFSP